MSTVMIIAGESSGELYGALLAKALKKKWHDVHIIGVGGEKMKEASVELVSHTSDAFGLVEAVSAFNKIRESFNRSVTAIREFRPDVLVLIDYPDFNLKVAMKAKSLGVKILYYVSPQVWAWRKGRVKKISSLVDKMATILPFEERIYANAGLPSEFVGHPILEEIESILDPESLSHPGSPGVDAVSRVSERRPYLKSILGLHPDEPLLSILPGSRPSELNRHLPLMLEVVRRIKKDPEMSRGTPFRFCMPLAPNTDERRYAPHLETLKREGVDIRKGEAVKVLAASDMAVVASGTATLQTAFLEVPMVVVYKLSPMTYHLGRIILTVRYISLVNILSGRGVVAELIQQRANPEEIIGELKKIMSDEPYRGGMLDAMRRIREPFAGRKASERVSEIVMELAGRK